MCGIAGYFAYRDGAVAPAEATLVAVRDRMTSRGPDGHGLWQSDDRRVGFAHRRLAIIDLSDAGLQPMAHDHLTIVFNGEIYNYRALKAELEALGCVFRSGSDTEVILQLFATHGAAAFARLRGMFAIAIHDASDMSLTFARDPYGIKPLYYADVGGCIRFASQVKALAGDPAISRALSPEGLAGFRLTGSVPEPFTILRDVVACPAGHVIRVDGHGVGSPKRFASIAETIREARPGLSPREALIDSVRHHLEADVPVGVFLSGGVDSGALTGLMRDCGQDEIDGVTLRFEEFAGTAADETERAVAIAAYYRVRHHIRTITEAEFRDDIPRIFDAMDQPSIDGFNSWLVSKAVHEIGLKVALSGLGGDELIGGYSTFRTVPQTHRWLGTPAKVPGIGAASRAALKLLAPGLIARNPKVAGLLTHAGSWGGAYLLRRAVLLPYEIDGAMDEGLAREGLAKLDIEARIADAIDPDPGSDHGRVTALESANYMRNQLLRDSDWAGMAHGLEIRVPLVDIALLGAMAPHFGAMQGSGGKSILADAPSRPLPSEIVNRAKSGFETPASSWLGSGKQATGDRTASRAAQSRVLANYMIDPALQVF